MCWAYSAVKRMLNPLDTRSTSSARQKVVAASVRVEVWGPWRMAAEMTAVGQGDPTCTGMPSSLKEERSAVAGCLDALGGGANVRDWQEPRKLLREGAAVIVAAATSAQWATGSLLTGTAAHLRRKAV